MGGVRHGGVTTDDCRGCRRRQMFVSPIDLGEKNKTHPRGDTYQNKMHKYNTDQSKAFITRRNSVRDSSSGELSYIREIRYACSIKTPDRIIWHCYCCCCCCLKLLLLLLQAVDVAISSVPTAEPTKYAYTHSTGVETHNLILLLLVLLLTASRAGLHSNTSKTKKYTHTHTPVVNTHIEETHKL